MMRWVVMCGCDTHGDHMSCEERCSWEGCTHPVGVEFTTPDEDGYFDINSLDSHNAQQVVDVLEKRIAELKLEWAQAYIALARAQDREEADRDS